MQIPASCCRVPRPTGCGWVWTRWSTGPPGPDSVAQLLVPGRVVLVAKAGLDLYDRMLGAVLLPTVSDARMVLCPTQKTRAIAGIDDTNDRGAWIMDKDNALE